MAGSLGEFGLSQSDRTPGIVETKEQPDTQKYIPVWTGFGGSTLGIIRDGLGPHGLVRLGVDVACEMGIIGDGIPSYQWLGSRRAGQHPRERGG